MHLEIAAIILGFFGLVWSADRFVAGAAATARNLGMPPILIGLTIVSAGTSAPEIIVSAKAAMKDASDLAVGNAIGSNLANIGMVLGITALLVPIPIARRLLSRELPFLLFVTALGAYTLKDLYLDQSDGFILLGCLALVGYRLLYTKTHQPNPEVEAELKSIPQMSATKAWIWFFVGLAFLIASADILVWGAKEVAQAFGVSQLIIGLTIVAIGTSLPELAASVASALKGHHDIALGNILGSNMLNILGVMAVPALIAPTQLEAAAFYRDYTAMTLITVLLAGIIYIKAWRNRKEHPSIGRIAGILFILLYSTYCYDLFLKS
jgi:cation:H+ antiporter